MQRYEDRLMPKEFDYRERFFKITIDQQIGIFQLNVESQIGKTDNYLTGFSGNSSFYTANIGFEKSRTSFNLTGSYALTCRYQLQNQKQFYYGARILSRLSDRTRFSLFIRIIICRKITIPTEIFLNYSFISKFFQDMNWIFQQGII